MHSFSFSSLRFALISLVLLVVSPAWILTLYTAWEDRQYRKSSVQENALRLAQIASSQQERLIEEGRHLLVGLARIPEVQSYNSTACCKIFTDILEQYPRYANLGAADPNGNVFCSAVPMTQPQNLANLPGFKRALKTHEFSIGNYQIGTIVGKPVLPLAYPSLDASGRIQVVVFATLDLTWLNEFAAEAKHPPGSTFTVVDRNGLILIRHPNPEIWVGRFMPEAPLVKTVLGRQLDGMTEIVGMDGVLRLYAFVPLRGIATGDAYLLIGVPTHDAFAETNRIFTRNLTYLGIVTLSILILTLVLGDILLLRRVNALLRTTQRLADGDLSARTDLPYGKGEIARLAFHFDQMAKALEHREIERRRAGEVVRLAKERLQFVFSNTPAVIYNCTPFGDYGTTFISDNVRRQLGYEPKKFIEDARFWADHVHQEDAPRIFADLPRLYEKGYHAHEYRFLHEDGTYRWMHDEMNLVRDTDGNAIEIVGYWIDITERKRMEDALHESREQLRAMAARLREVEEDERRRLAQELHDLVGQNLTALGINLHILRSQLATEAAGKIRDRLEDSLRLVTLTTEDIRNVMAELCPPVLKEFGILAALQWYADRFSKLTGLAIIVRGEDLMPRLPADTEIGLFRIAQEALTNAAKHARAKQVILTLEEGVEEILLTIADDGVGFDPGAHREPEELSKWGLITMRERAEQLGGHLRVHSKPGKGTLIIAEIRR